MAGVVMQRHEAEVPIVEEYGLSEQKNFLVLGKRISSKYDTQTLEPCE